LNAVLGKESHEKYVLMIWVELHHIQKSQVKVGQLTDLTALQNLRLQMRQALASRADATDGSRSSSILHSSQRASARESSSEIGETRPEEIGKRLDRADHGDDAGPTRKRARREIYEPAVDEAKALAWTAAIQRLIKGKIKVERSVSVYVLQHYIRTSRFD
jgi:hypothetical protein